MDALSRIEPQINLIHYPQQNLITESAPINLYRNQIIVQKSNTPSLKIIKKTIFKNRITFITPSRLKENDVLSIIKNYFHPKRVNAVFIPNSDFYEVFKETVLKYFSHDSRLKIAKCDPFSMTLLTKMHYTILLRRNI